MSLHMWANSDIIECIYILLPALAFFPKYGVPIKHICMNCGSLQHNKLNLS